MKIIISNERMKMEFRHEMEITSSQTLEYVREKVLDYFWDMWVPRLDRPVPARHGLASDVILTAIDSQTRRAIALIDSTDELHRRIMETDQFIVVFSPAHGGSS